MNYLVKAFIFLCATYTSLTNAHIKSVNLNAEKCTSPLSYYLSNTEQSKLLDVFSDCPRLYRYLKQNDFDYMSIVFANPTLSTPMSYFGHTFIVFNNKNSLNFSKVYSYSAIVPENKTFLELVNASIFGGLRGKYSFSNYYEVKREYIEKEQRSLIHYTLNLTKHEQNILQLKAYETYDELGEYNFFNQNCTTELLGFLRNIRPNTSELTNYSPYFQPSELINLLIKVKLINKPSFVFPALIDELYESYQLKTINEQKLINKLTTSSAGHDLKPIKLSDSVKHDIHLIADIKFKYQHEVLDNFSEINLLTYEQPKAKLNVNHELISEVHPKEFKLGYSYSSMHTGYKVAFKPAFISRTQLKISDIYSGTLNLLNTEFMGEGGALYLTKFDLLEIESFSNSFSTFNFHSWRFWLGATNHHTFEKSLKWELDIAYGKTWGSNNFQLSILPQFNYSFNTNEKYLELLNDVLWRNPWGNINLNYIISKNKDKSKIILKYEGLKSKANYSYSLQYSGNVRLLEFSVNKRF